jgi:prepilin-type N-terminal cleavage/methylation domain-containing protein
MIRFRLFAVSNMLLVKSKISSRFKLSHNLQLSSGFTLMELVIVVALLSILATLVFVTDLTGSLKKARDNTRKQDLNKLTRILDDYYNDNQRYPPMNVPGNGQIAGAAWGSTFTPYTSRLPKDPLSPNRWYYYQSEPLGNFYVIYTILENDGDPDITLKGCQNGCGPYNPLGKRLYNYVVTSGNIRMFNGYPDGYDPGQDNYIPGVTPGVVTIPASPSPTPYLGPTPTVNLTPPPNVPGSCGYEQCCLYSMCGDTLSTSEGGIGFYCTSHQRCMYSIISGNWNCVNDCTCPYGCD